MPSDEHHNALEMTDSQTNAETIDSSPQNLTTNLDTEDSNLEADIQKDAGSTSATDSTSNEPTNSSPASIEQHSSSENSQTIGSSHLSTQTSTDSSKAKDTLAENSQSKEISPNNPSDSSQPGSQSFPHSPDNEPTLNDSTTKKDEAINTHSQSQLPEKVETKPRDSTASLSTTDLTAEPKLTDQVADYKLPISKVLPYQGLPNILPSVPWVSTHTPGATASQTPQATSSRKLTSPFSWLSRTTAKEASTTSVMSNQQGQTVLASSSATSPSFETTLSKTDEGEEPNASTSLRRPGRGSLKDRFKMLRLQEEVGITSLAEDEGSSNEQIKSVQTDQRRSNNTKSKQSPTSNSPVSTSPGPSLPPGMASGISEGPSNLVDWDLWQSVVDEGPTAVARSSPEELNRAITSGIPNAIRGVVWQILAQSRNEELESMYKDLVLRGTEKDKDRMSGSSGFASIANSLNGKDEQVVSSSSSVSSEHSVANSIATGLKSPTTPKDSDNTSKLQATAVAERKKKAKEDAESVKKLEKMIKRDLGARTSFSKFATSAGLQDGLFGVCKAYALFDEGVGYAQGMNFLVMPLLFNMPENEAFCLLVKLMNQYRLRDLFIQDMPGLHKHLYQFERFLEDFEPALFCHLQRRQVTPHLYATQWFLTLFAYRFPLQLVLRIYDLILSEGLQAILKFGIVLMQRNAKALLEISDMVALTNFLKDRLFDVYIDAAPSSVSILESGFFGSSGSSIDKEIYRADQLIQDACAVKITPEALKIYALEWEEKTRLEKAREMEMETLRLSNQKLSVKVRRLEKRVQEHDTEHAALATELVHHKVENEELKDENESLKVQVKELRDVIEKLPRETEERLQSEMDRLIKRNQEVHDENNRLEEDMSEMEKTLVATKMQYAEINAAHETLTRRWTDLRKALDE
ncbi:unnamed protein product [Blumeria hordei]|uniref:GTPase-activating protein GYP5 n=1 Tax=Blumeria hordei TaxID=2867405 RepID=A0A383UPQ6_BLUHO|nr:unnamed protein product [Blumeria hordei]